ncbi:MAG: DEAD/DEAH box helicase [Spirosomataceae bacterium]
MNRLLFSELGLSEFSLQAVTDMGFDTASPIQSEAIPFLLEGRDVIGQAQTGTGKTAAFGIPIVEKVNPESRATQALILCPTRELAVQVSDEIKKLLKYRKGVYVGAIYGGDSIERQIRDLKKGLQIVVGTPGRVIDHLERGTLQLDNLKMMVLDEADEMLDMGFREDIESILDQTPEDRQTVLFSATMSKPILALTTNYQTNPKLVKVVKNEITNDNIEQLYFDVKAKAKMEVMCRLIDFYQLKLILVFSNTKAKVDEIVENLTVRGYAAEGLHGDMRQQARNTVMTKFRSGNTNILVATDVAARGIDVNDVDAVINYDIPLDEEYYVHRIGRTGRAGKSGKAFSLIVGAERYRLRDIMAYTKVKIEKGVIPSFSDIVGVKKARFIEHIESTISEGNLDLFQDVLEALHHAGHATPEIVAALVKLSMGVQQSEFGDENLDGEIERQLMRQNRDRDGFGNRNGRNDKFGGRFEKQGIRGEERGGFRNDKPRFDQGGKPFKKGREAGMARIMINIGKAERITPSHIVGALAGETGIKGNQIGHIDLQERVTYVDVPQESIQKIISSMHGNFIKGKRVRVAIAD